MDFVVVVLEAYSHQAGLCPCSVPSGLICSDAARRDLTREARTYRALSFFGCRYPAAAWGSWALAIETFMMAASWSASVMVM